MLEYQVGSVIGGLCACLYICAFACVLVWLCVCVNYEMGFLCFHMMVVIGDRPS